MPTAPGGQQASKVQHVIWDWSCHLVGIDLLGLTNGSVYHCQSHWPPPKEEETVNGCLAETAKGHLKKLRAALALQLEKPSCNISVQMLKLCGSLKPQI